jgi:transposase
MLTDTYQSSNPNLMETLYFLGVDMGKENYHAALTVDGLNFYDQEVKNSSAAIKQYFQRLMTTFGFKPHQLIVCMEHTGIYCHPLLDHLAKQGIKIYLEPAVRIKQSQGLQRGKNDKIDSKRIAKFVFKNHGELRLWNPKREVIQRLKALLIVRERLVKAKNQLEVPIKESSEFIQTSIVNQAAKNCRCSIQAIKKDIKKLNQEIEKVVKEDATVSQQMKVATSVIGVGPIIAANMIVTTNEFKDISQHKQYACYAGIAPFEHSSGTSIRGRTRVSHMANKTMKCLLHLGARSAIKYSPEIKQYYERKCAEGKPKMSVLNAVCNKLISRVFVCINNNRLYQKNYERALA